MTCMVPVPAVILMILTFPCIHGQRTDIPDEVMNSPSGYYLFKPLLSHCTSCIKSDDKFSTRVADGTYAAGFEVSFTANGTSFRLSLQLNEGIIPVGFSISYVGYDWEPVKTYKEQSIKEINNCYYHGHVIGMEDSYVIASTCRGLKGTIYLPSDVLHFIPIEGEDFMHALYRKIEATNSSCGNPHADFFHRSITVPDAEIAPVRLRRAEKQQKFVELLFVASKGLHDRFEKLEDLHAYVKEIINYVDGVYKKIDLRVVLLHLEVWSKEDKIPAETDAQKVLNHFLAYRTGKVQESGNANSPWKYTDNAQLLFGGKFDGTTIGMATVSSMCGLRSGGVNEAIKGADVTASTLAHEMGHNLGMSHDSKSCTCSAQRCIMAAVSSFTPPNTWSTCSVQDLERGYRNGNGVCLSNVPDSSKLFGGPKCGNGIVEKNEECDCGTVEECDSRCCNATTCKLHQGAACDSGACCTADCRYKDSCHICRSAENDCDITEYCTGRSAHCPNNVHKLDGLDCNSQAGLCYGGICRTHESQCKEVWGPEAVNGPDVCYENVNTAGNWNGNCGKDGARFKPCLEKDVLCGKLICMGGASRPLLATNRYFFIMTFGTGTDRFVCKTVQSTNGTSDSGDVASVSDGTKCGDGKICFNSACVDADTVLRGCSMDCHGHGVCNNFGNCHCEAGYGPPDCKNKGDGGSVDSGPICATGVELQVILLIVFFVVILPIVLGLFFYIWWRVCGGRQKMYAWRKNRQYRRGQKDPTKLDNVVSRDKAKPVTTRSTKPVTSKSKVPDGYFSSLQPASSSYPAESGIGQRPQAPKRPSAPAVLNASRLPPPNRPSPRFPPRSVPPRPGQPNKPFQPPRPPVAYKPNAYPDHGNSTANSNSSSVQARIAQMQKDNSNWS